MAVGLLIAGAGPGPALAQRCVPTPGLAPLLEPGRILLLGEIHGTREAPEFVESAVCEAQANGLSVTVALELPQVDQPIVDGFLRSAGASDDRSAVLASPFWARGYQDGRTSLAMFELLDALRERVAAGQSLEVVLIDRPEARTLRDSVMAIRLLEVADSAPSDVIVALVGNLHNRITEGSDWMGRRLVDRLGERVFSLLLSNTGGDAWVCSDGCGRMELTDRPASGPGVVILDPGEATHYHGRVSLGTAHASEPAKDSTHHEDARMRLKTASAIAKLGRSDLFPRIVSTTP